MKTIPILWALGCAAALSFTARAAAEAENAPGLWWFEGSLGYGSVERQSSDRSETSGLFYLSLAGGRVVMEQFWLGVEATGWSYQASDLNDPAKGEALSQILLSSRVLLGRQSPWHLAVGAGYAAHWSNHPDETRDSGFAWSTGVGYDFAPARRSSCVVRLLVSGSRLGDDDFRAITATVGWRWR